MENIKDCKYFDKCNHIDCQTDFCIKKHKLDFLYKNSLLSPTQMKHIMLVADADGTDIKEYKFIVSIIDNIEDFIKNGQNLFLHSANCGVGKTVLSIRAISSYFDKIWSKSDLVCRALFISVPRFLLALKDNINVPSEYIAFIKENILKADLVVWDDLGTKVASDFELNHLLSLIDARLALGKSNIYTSNLSVSQMQRAFGDRLTSRVCNFSEDVELHGKDKRAISPLKQDLKAYNKK